MPTAPNSVLAKVHNQQSFEDGFAASELEPGMGVVFVENEGDAHKTIEIAKTREGEASTGYALRRAHQAFLQLWAPFLPHVTEEIWQALYATEGEFESLHTGAWPVAEGHDADLAAGETAMEVVSALRRYKSERQLPLNADLERVSVYGPIEGFDGVIRDVMHVGELDHLEDPPEITTEVGSIDLDYSKVGPEYGSKVGEIDAGIEAGEYELRDDVLAVAGEELAAELFSVERERTYSGDGEMVETESAVVIVS